MDASGYDGTLEELQLLHHEIRTVTSNIARTDTNDKTDWLHYGLKCLPNLKSVAFVQDIVGRSGWFAEYPWLATAYHIAPMPSAKPVMCWHEPTETSRVLPYDDDGDEAIYGIEDLPWIIRNQVDWTDGYSVFTAIQLAGITIQEFSIFEEMDHGTAHPFKTPDMSSIWCQHQYFDFTLPQISFFSTLVKLSFLLERPETMQDQLSSLLRDAKCLEELRLDCGIFDPFLHQVAPYFDPLVIAFTNNSVPYDLAGQSTMVKLPKLRVLSVSNSAVSPTVLGHVLSSHPGIKSLSLRNLFNSFTGIRSIYNDAEGWQCTPEELKLSRKEWELTLDIIKRMDLPYVSLKNITGFIRVMDSTCPISKFTSRGKGFTVADEEMMKSWWASLGICYGKMPAGISKKQFIPSWNIFGVGQVSDTSLAHIKQEKLKMEKMIMAYLKHETNINPLVGLNMYVELRWRSDEIFNKVMESDGEIGIVIHRSLKEVS